jgi:hypothetical protein
MPKLLTETRIRYSGSGFQKFRLLVSSFYSLIIVSSNKIKKYICYNDKITGLRDSFRPAAIGAARLLLFIVSVGSHQRLGLELPASLLHLNVCAIFVAN